MQAVADRRYVLLLMGGLIALAWLTLWLWGQSPYGRWLHHDELSRADLGNGPVVLVMGLGWPRVATLEAITPITDDRDTSGRAYTTSSTIIEARGVLAAR
jgi:hypothetical protein